MQYLHSAEASVLSSERRPCSSEKILFDILSIQVDRCKHMHVHEHTFTHTIILNTYSKRKVNMVDTDLVDESVPSRVQ